MTKRPIVVALAYTKQLSDVLSQKPAPAFVGAECAAADPELFFSDDFDEIAAAKGICATCPLIDPCANWAAANEEFGVFGGLTANERRLLRGNKPVFTVVDVDQVQREFTFITSASADHVSQQFGVDRRTVVRWRRMLRDNGLVG